MNDIRPFFYVYPDGLVLPAIAGGEAETAPAEEAPAEAPPAEVPPEAQPEAQAQQPAPWAQDLASAFPDETLRTSVDGFLRDKVQPYVTQLESQRAPAEALSLYNDFTNDPDVTFLAVAEELYGEEGAQAVLHVLEGGDPAELSDEQLAAATGTEQEEAPADEWEDLPPAVREATDFYRQQQEDAEYSAAIADVVADERYSDLFQGIASQTAEDLLAPFVLTADGDPDHAVSLYREWASKINTGQVTPEQAARAEAEGITPDEVPEPPTTAGGAPPANVPTNRDYGGDIGAAVDDWLQEERARKAPPPVGGV